jgi:3-hydroxyisobutyrate dehydrogenase-like beta-hydroxyacid dehydrogenase
MAAADRDEWKMTAQPVLFVGAGKIGMPIVRRMRARDLDVHVSDTSAETLAELAREDFTVIDRSSISRLTYAKAILCLPDPAGSTSVIADWIKHGLPARAIVADMTTMPPSAARKHADMLAASRGTYLDVPVSGGQRGAESGEMVVIAGGPRSAFEAMLAIFQAIGNTVHHSGAVGSASLLKAVNQFVFLSYNLAFAQGLRVARDLGLPEAIVMDMLTKGAPAHPLINDRLPSTIQSGYRTGFLLKRCLKDLDCLEVPAGAHADDSAAMAAYEHLRHEIGKAVENGLGERDILVLSQVEPANAG